MYDHRDIALQARDLAIQIEENRDGEIRDGWARLLSAVRKAFNAEHPDAVERLLELEKENT